MAVEMPVIPGVLSSITSVYRTVVETTVKRQLPGFITNHPVEK